MALTEKPSARINKQNIIATKIESNAGIKALRLLVSSKEENVIIPPSFSSFSLRNAGDLDVRIRFTEDPEDQYFTIKPGEHLPVLTINSKTAVRLLAVDGISTVEIILWG